MSDNDPSSQTPSKQTSSVPLKKETVRVTLKAAEAPPAAPIAAVPGAPAVRPPAPPAPPVAGPPRPTAPAPTIALKPAGAPTAPAPTIRLATSTAPIGAPTIALKTATQPLGAGGAPSLPKATVQLQAPTQPLGAGATSASQLATFEMDEEDESGVGGFIKILSVVGFIAACVLFYFQFDIAKIWVDAPDRDEMTKGDYQLLLEEDPNGTN